MDDHNEQSYESGEEGKGEIQGGSGSQNGTASRGGGGGGRPGGRNKMMGGMAGGPPGPNPAGNRQNDFPLRILVMGDMVGAIIGRQGTTIRQITQQTRARVDVHRKDNSGSMEKAITIYGNPENCSNACKRILEVLQEEAKNTNKGEIPLKILAHNSLIGRIIGKAGNVIKKIMQDSDTKITVSSINDINSFNFERVITIKGTIENISKAEQMISQKLKASYENDLQQMAPQAVMFPGIHPMTMMSTPLGSGYGARPPMGFYSGPGGAPPGPPHPYGPPAPVYPQMHPPGAGPPGMMNSHPQPNEEDPSSQETTFMYVPNSAVGALIGTKGSFIRSIIRFSNASVKIAPLAQDQQVDSGYERQVTIVGNPEAQWKAQWMIFEKMREEGYNAHGMEEVRLTVEIFVPSSQVGRIIGKGGQNVRELQRYTGASVKVPEQGDKNDDDKTRDRDVSVHIIGNFYAVQSAQRRVRAMVASAYGPGGGKGRNPRMGNDSPNNESPTGSLQ